MKKRILIVEDEVFIAHDLKAMVEEIGFEVVGIAPSFTQAVQMVNVKSPDLVLIDISIQGPKSGIDLAYFLRDKHSVPYIYITSHSDQQTIQKAIETMPAGYIIKPFNKNEVFVSMECAFNVFASSQEELVHSYEPVKVAANAIIFKDDQITRKLPFSELLLVRAVGNYVELHGRRGRYLIRYTFQEVSRQLPVAQFIQIHRSYMVSKKDIQSIDGNVVHLEGIDEPIPVSRSFRSGLMDIISS